MDKSTCDLLIRNAQIITIWEGFECEGYPVKTMLRGKVIVEEEKNWSESHPMANGCLARCYPKRWRDR